MTADDLAVCLGAAPLIARPARPTVPEVVPLVELYLRGRPAGGSLHIVVCDENIADADLALCAARSTSEGDAAGIALVVVLLRMTATQRRRVARSARWSP